MNISCLKQRATTKQPTEQKPPFAFESLVGVEFMPLAVGYSFIKSLNISIKYRLNRKNHLIRWTELWQPNIIWTEITVDCFVIPNTEEWEKYAKEKRNNNKRSERKIVQPQHCLNNTARFHWISLHWNQYLTACDSWFLLRFFLFVRSTFCLYGSIICQASIIQSYIYISNSVLRYFFLFSSLCVSMLEYQIHLNWFFPLVVGHFVRL